jgi:pimeloyl-ACP methyl ester carboxylesterase
MRLPGQARQGTLAGMTLHHTVSGTGPPVVLLHAGVADGRMWAAQTSTGPGGLADRFTLVVPDLRGFGRSPMPAPGDAPWSNAGDVLTLLDQLGLDAASVVGSSYGGRVALEMATLAPERVDRLVLVCAALGGLEPTASVEAFGDEEEALLEAEDIDAATDLNVRTWLGPDADDAARELVREMQRHAFVVQLAADEVDPEDVTVDLARVTMPTTVFYGAKDLDFFGDVARHLHKHLPQSDLVELPWAGHLPTLERPDEMAGRLVTALTN